MIPNALDLIFDGYANGIGGPPKVNAIKMNSVLKFTVLTLLLSFVCVKASADHISGANMEYKCLGGGQFLITLNVFQDCSDPSTNANETVWVIKNSGGFFSQSLTLTAVEEVSQLCSAQIDQSLCNGGTLPGKRHLTYTGIVNYDGTSLSYRVRWIRNYRTPSLNVDNTSTIQFYVHTIINFETDLCNDSPLITIQQSPFICVGNQANLNFGVFDPEQDSLHFSFTEALQPAPSNGFIPVIYEPGYSGAVPIPGATIDPITGQMQFTPPAQGEYTIAVLVEQFNDAGEFLGSQIIDILVVARICPDAPPQPMPDNLINVTGTAVLEGPNSLSMCYGDNFCADYVFQSSSSSAAITVTSNLEFILPGATLTVTGTNPATATICWDGSSQTTGGTIILIASDDLCPIPGLATGAFSVDVLQGVFAGPDQYYCNGSAVQLEGSGSSIYTWSSVSGDGIGALSCTNCANPILTPTQPSVFSVVGDDTGNGCSLADEVSVLPALEHITSIVQTGCGDDDGEISIEITTGSGDYSVDFEGSLISMTGNQFDTTMLSTGVYNITLIDNLLGCSDSFTSIVSSGVGTPDPDITPIGPICSLETDLDGSVNSGTVLWSGTGPGVVSFDNNTLEDPHVTVSVAGTYTLYISETETCTGVDSIQITFGPPEMVTASNDTTICGDTFQLFGNASGGTWSWLEASGQASFSPSSTVSNPTVTAPSFGNYTFFWTHLDDNLCSSVGQVDIDFREQPIAQSVDTLYFCQLLGNTLDATPVPPGFSGQWNIPTGTFAYNPILPNSFIDNNGTYGEFEAIWTVSNSTFCVDSDTTLMIYSAPEQADISGFDLQVCGPSAVVTAVNTTGTWSSPDPELTFGSPNNSSSTVTASSAGAYVFEWTVGSGICATSDSRTIVFYDSSSVNITTPPSTICSSGSVQLNATAANGIGITWSTSGDGTFSDTNTLSSSYTPGVNDSINGSVTLTLTNTGEEVCPDEFDQITIVIISAPAVSAVSGSPAICSTNTVSLDGTALNTLSIEWSSSGDGTFSPNQNVEDPTYSPGDIDISNGSVTLTIAGQALDAACSSVNSDVLLIIEEATEAGQDSSLSVCESGAVIDVMTLFGPSADTGGSIVDVDASGALSGAIFDPEVAGVGVYEFTYTVSGDLPCPDEIATATITVTTSANAGTGSTIAVCDNNGSVDCTSLLSGSPDAGGLWEDPLSTGALAGSIFDPAVSGAGTFDIYYIVSLTGCENDTAFVSIDFGANPTLDLGVTAITICGDETLDLIATVTNADSVLWVTTGDGIFLPTNGLNTVYSPGPTDISSGMTTLTATAYGSDACIQPTADLVLTINLAPVAGTGFAIERCESDPIVDLFTLLAGSPDLGGSWIDLSSSGALVGGMFDPSLSGAGDFDIIYVVSQSICDNDTAFVSVSVGLSPMIDLGTSTLVICGNESVDLTATVSNTDSVLWISSGDGVFLPSNGLNTVYTPGPTDISNGTATLIATAYGANACSQPFGELDLTINIAPVAGDGYEIDRCVNDGAIDLFTLLTASPDAGGTWVDLSSSGALSGGIFNPGIAGMGEFDLTYTISLAGCPDDTSFVTIDIGSVPTISLGTPFLSICGNETANLSVIVNNTDSVLWTTAGDGVFATDNTAITAYTPGPLDISTGLAMLSCTAYGNSACPNSSLDMNLTILQPPYAGVGLETERCIGAPLVDLFPLLTGSPDLGGIWEDLSSSGALISNSFDPAVSGTGEFDLIYIASLAGCANDTSFITIQVLGSPSIALGTLSINICENEIVDIASTTLNTDSVLWSTTGDGFFDPSNNVNTSYSPGPADQGAGNSTLILTAYGASVCPTASASIELHLDQQPDAGLNNSLILCLSSNIVDLASLLSPSAEGGGIWTDIDGSGGLSGSLFDPSIVTPGVYELGYTVSGLGACPDSTAIITAQVITAAYAGEDAFTTVCQDAGPIDLFSLLTGGPQIGGVWTAIDNGSGFSAGTVDVGLLPPGSYQYSYEVSIIDCSESDISIVTVTVAGSPTIDIVEDSLFICSAEVASLESFGTNVLNYQWMTSGDGAFSAIDNSINDYSVGVQDIINGGVMIHLAGIGASECAAAIDSVYLLISPAISIDLPLGPLETCGDDALLIEAFITNFSSINWSISGDGSFSNSSIENPEYTPGPLDILNGSADLELEVTGIGACPESLESITITIATPPSAGADASITLCISGSSVDLFPLLGPEAQATGTWSSDPALTGSVYDPTIAGLGTSTLTYTVDGGMTCPSASVEVAITVGTGANAGDDTGTIVCESITDLDLFSELNGSPDPGGTWADISGSGAMTNGIFDASINGVGSYLFEYISTFDGCADDISSLAVEVIAAPTVSILDPSLSICSGGSISLEAFATDAVSLEWSTSGSGDFEQANNAMTNYLPSQEEIDIGSATVSITALGTTGCTPATAQHQFSINLEPLADAGIDADTCGLSYLLAPDPSVGAGIWSGGTGVTFSDPSDPFALVTVNEPGTYMFTWSEDNAGCIDSDELTVTFAGSPAIVDSEFICVNTNTEYVVIIELTGGDPNTYQFSVNGTLSGNTFTSDPFPTGSPYVISAWDENQCTQLTIEGEHLCPSLTFPGTIDTDSLNLCDGDLIEPLYFDDFFLDANDALVFILHDASPGPGNIIASSIAPSFTFQAGMDINTTYYVSAVAGDDIGGGLVDLEDPSSVYSEAVPVTFYTAPSLEFLSTTPAFCVGDSALIEVELDGVPSFSFEYLLGGNFNTIVVAQSIGSFYVDQAGLLTVAAVTDAYCSGSSSASIEVLGNELPTASIIDSLVFCSADGDVFEVSLTGTAPWGYSLLLDGVEIAQPQSLMPVDSIAPGSSGTYTITDLQDATCFSNESEEIVVLIIQNPIADAGPDLSICSGDVALIGGVTALNTTYLWSDTEYLSIPDSSFTSVDFPLSGNEVVQQGFIITSTYLGCSSEDEVILTVNPLPDSYGIEGPQDICLGDTVALQAFGGQSYTWTADLTLSNPLVPSPVIFPFEDTNYEVMITNEFGCDVMDSISVLVHPIPVPLSSSIVISGCLPAQVLMINETEGDLTSCEWNIPGGELTTDDCTIAEVIYEEHGIFSGWLTVTSIYGCTSTALTDTIQIFNAEAQFEFSPAIPTIDDSLLYVFDQSENVFSQVWTIDDEYAGSGVNPILSLGGLRPDFYEVCLIMTSNEGCIDTTCYKFELENNVSVYVPNSFTPDGDGLNDEFKAVVHGQEYVENYELKVFDRNGRLQFETNRIEEGWTAVNNHDNVYAQSLYEWSMVIKIFGEPYPRQYRGTITILK